MHLKKRGLVFVAVIGLAACGLAFGILVVLAGAAPASAVSIYSRAEVCVGVTTTPQLRVGAYVDACFPCSSLTPWMQMWPYKACVTVPWLQNPPIVFGRWGFEFPP